MQAYLHLLPTCELTAIGLSTQQCAQTGHRCWLCTEYATSLQTRACDGSSKCSAGTGWAHQEHNHTGVKGKRKGMLRVQQTWSEGAAEAAAEAGAAAAGGVEEMAVTKEGMACASSSLGLHAPGPAPHPTYIAYPEDRCVWVSVATSKRGVHWCRPVWPACYSSSPVVKPYRCKLLQ